MILFGFYFLPAALHRARTNFVIVVVVVVVVVVAAAAASLGFISYGEIYIFFSSPLGTQSKSS